MKECFREYKPDLVILQETKKEKIVPHLIWSLAGGDLYAWIDDPAIGVSGGLLLLWNPLVLRKVDELIGCFSISVQFVEISSGFEWMFTGVYGSCSAYSCHLFWDELFDI